MKKHRAHLSVALALVLGACSTKPAEFDDRWTSGLFPGTEATLRDHPELPRTLDLADPTGALQENQDAVCIVEIDEGSGPLQWLLHLRPLPEHSPRKVLARTYSKAFAEGAQLDVGEARFQAELYGPYGTTEEPARPVAQLWSCWQLEHSAVAGFIDIIPAVESPQHPESAEAAERRIVGSLGVMKLYEGFLAPLRSLLEAKVINSPTYLNWIRFFAAVDEDDGIDVASSVMRYRGSEIRRETRMLDGSEAETLVLPLDVVVGGWNALSIEIRCIPPRGGLRITGGLLGLRGANPGNPKKSLRLWVLGCGTRPETAE